MIKILLDTSSDYTVEEVQAKGMDLVPLHITLGEADYRDAYDLTKDKLMNDLNTFGFLFEALVERDLKVYMEYLDGNLFHFRDNTTGLEVDAILEFSDGEYASVEIKLGLNQVEEAKKNLLNFNNNMIKKPKFMCIIVGFADIIARDPETGIYIVPITALKP